MSGQPLMWWRSLFWYSRLLLILALHVHVWDAVCMSCALCVCVVTSLHVVLIILLQND